MARLHLPDIHGAIGALNQQEIVNRTPFDGLNREHVPARHHDRLPFLQTQQRHRMVTGDGADAVQHASVAPGGRGDQLKNLPGLAHESVLKLTQFQIPNTHSEINSTGDEHSGVVARIILTWVEQRRDFALMAPQETIDRQICPKIPTRIKKNSINQSIYGRSASDLKMEQKLDQSINRSICGRSCSDLKMKQNWINQSIDQSVEDLVQI